MSERENEQQPFLVLSVEDARAKGFDVPEGAEHLKFYHAIPVSTPPVPQEGPKEPFDSEKVLSTVADYIGLSSDQRQRLIGCLDVLHLKLFPQSTPSRLISEETPPSHSTWAQVKGKYRVTDDELNALEELHKRAYEGFPWVADEYDYITCGKGIVCEVRGIGRDMNVSLRDYIASLHPITVGKMIEEIRASRIK